MKTLNRFLIIFCFSFFTISMSFALDVRTSNLRVNTTTTWTTINTPSTNIITSSWLTDINIGNTKIITSTWSSNVKPMNLSNNRKYASTRMKYCDENDIIVWNRAWASCNSTYDIKWSKWMWWTNVVSDMNGWKYWKMYKKDIVCPDWYSIPTYNEFKNTVSDKTIVETMKLPAAWYWTDNWVGYSKDLIWLYYARNGYLLTTFYFKLDSFTTMESTISNDQLYSLRCVRNQNVTTEEKNSNIKATDTPKSLINRKYAATKMTICKDYDVILWDRVWASCNNEYPLAWAVFYDWEFTSPTDINWWNLWRLYLNTTKSCPAGYSVPTAVEWNDALKTEENISILKLPLAWYWYYADNKINYISKDLRWQYNQVTDNKWYMIIYKSPLRVQKANPDWKFYYSLRCIRNEKVNDDDKKLIKSNISVSFNNTLIKNLWWTSSWSTNTEDDAVFKEINKSFIEVYNIKLNDINTSINKLKTEKDKQTDPVMKQMYEDAIKKWEKIKSQYISKYKFIIDYSK